MKEGVVGRAECEFKKQKEEEEEGGMSHLMKAKGKVGGMDGEPSRAG